MIHQAARDMALAHMSQEAWDALLSRNAISSQHFIGVEYYADDETMALVRIIAAELGLPINEALYQFGRYWIAFAGASAYGRVLSMAGDDLEAFVENLDRMHASIKSNMPKAQMPSFQVAGSERGLLRVMYRSERDGLAPFVQGILGAVAERFGETVSITYQETSDGVQFEIRRLGAEI